MATASPTKSLRSSSLRQPASASSRTEYVNIGTPEETVLETYFVMLSKFNFYRARELCDRERESKSATGGANWCEFMAALNHLTAAEMNYFSLSFMERSWSSSFRIVKKESLKATYEGLIQDLRKVYDVYYHGKGGTDYLWERKMTELVSHIMEFVAAKRDMTDFYVHFEQVDGCLLDYRRMDRYLKDMHERYKESFQHSFLKPIKTTFMREIGVLMDLLRAQHHISEWQFLPAILSIQASHNKLTIWNGVVPLGSQADHSSKQVRRVHPSPQKQQQSSTPLNVPYLYKWICKFHVSLLAKLTLYFHQVLSEHASVYDMKHLAGKLDVDYVSSLFAVIRQTPAICCCLLFDSNGVPDFKGPKYHFPDSPAPILTGLQSYPFMITVPYEFDFHHHRPNIVSMVIIKSHQLSSSPQMVIQHDEKLHCTYYMTQVDPRVTLVTISASRGRDKDGKTISLLIDIASQLRNTHVAALLRPG